MNACMWFETPAIGSKTTTAVHPGYDRYVGDIDIPMVVDEVGRELLSVAV